MVVVVVVFVVHEETVTVVVIVDVTVAELALDVVVGVVPEHTVTHEVSVTVACPKEISVKTDNSRKATVANTVRKDFILINEIGRAHV